MFGADMVEPTDHLYQEGNVIGKHSKNKHRKNKKEHHNKDQKSNENPAKLKNPHKEGLGNLVDIEV